MINQHFNALVNHRDQRNRRPTSVFGGYIRGVPELNPPTAKLSVSAPLRGAEAHTLLRQQRTSFSRIFGADVPPPPSQYAVACAQ